MAKIDTVQEVSLNMLRPYERNAKIHDEKQVEQIARSIKEFGFLNPCLIDRENNIIAGHGRVLAAQKLGLKTVPCVYIEGLTPEQRRAYILADNRLTELGGWDKEIVSQELEELKDLGFDIGLTGFGIDDIIFDEFEEEEPEAEAAEEEEEIQVQQGDIWRLGDHRLMCGDSTNWDQVQQLLDGAEMDLVETDPPYNVAIESKKGETIANDDMPARDFYIFLCSVFSIVYKALKPGGAYYCWHPSSGANSFMDALEEANLPVRQTLIWVKNGFTLGRQDYQWKHEPCLYGWKEGAPHYFIDLRSLDTVWEMQEETDAQKMKQLFKAWIEDVSTVQHDNKPARAELHPTCKPIGLIKKQIRNSSRERERVLDLFGGSGTTLLACEELNRVCYMMEFDPKYASRIIRRFEQETGKKAVKIS